MTRENVLREKDLLKKAATIKRFEYSPLGSVLIINVIITEPKTFHFDLPTGPAKWISKWRGHGTLKSLVDFEL